MQKYLAHAAGLEEGGGGHPQVLCDILKLVLHLSQLLGAPVLCSIM